jgi:hypothetical protein
LLNFHEFNSLFKREEPGEEVLDCRTRLRVHGSIQQESPTKVASLSFHIDLKSIVINLLHFLHKVEEEKIHRWFFISEIDTCKDRIAEFESALLDMNLKENKYLSPKWGSSLTTK